ncbi:putative transporter [Xylariales sp. PMI_506]|nr:putative transporter [Xylariales sp. PMI_506]
MCDMLYPLEETTPGEVVRERPNPSSHPFLISHLGRSHEALMLVTLVCTQVMALGCLSQGIFPGEIIGQSFNTTASESNWGPAAYGLTSSAFMLPAGRTGDIFGHRRCYIVAWIWLALSSLLTGLSVYCHSFIFYSVCRGLQGLGTAMMIPCALAILGSVYKDGPRKNLAFSLFAAGSPTGFTLGGVFSGLLAELAWWPWVFWVTAIACCILAAMSAVTIPRLPGDSYRRGIPSKTQDQGADKVSRLEFDWAGTVSGISGLVLFNIAWNQAPTVGWKVPFSIVTLIIGFLLLLFFGYIEHRARHPLIPVDSLSIDSIFVLATMALAWASFGVLVLYLVNFITQLRDETILSTAAQFTPVPFAGFAASYLNSVLLSHGISPIDILAFSCIWFIVGNTLSATMPVHQSFWRQVFWVNVLAPLGIDLSFPSATLTISRLVPPERQGVAASLIATVVYYSQSIGLGMAGTVQACVAHGNVLKGYRGAFYTGIGFSTLSLTEGYT